MPHIEQAFREKYNRVRTALDHPEEVTRIMEEELRKKGDDPPEDFEDLSELEKIEVLESL